MPSTATRKRFRATRRMSKLIEGLPLPWTGQAGQQKPRRRGRRLLNLSKLNLHTTRNDHRGTEDNQNLASRVDCARCAARVRGVWLPNFADVFRDTRNPLHKRSAALRARR